MCLNWMHTHRAMAPHGVQACTRSEACSTLLAGAAPEWPPPRMTADPKRQRPFRCSPTACCDVGSQHLMTIRGQMRHVKDSIPIMWSESQTKACCSAPSRDNRQHSRHMEQLIGHNVCPVCRDDGECDLSHGRVVHVSQPGCCGRSQKPSPSAGLLWLAAGTLCTERECSLRQDSGLGLILVTQSKAQSQPLTPCRAEHLRALLSK